MKSKLVFLMVSLLLLPSALMSQDRTKSLERVSDDLKFQNAKRFIRISMHDKAVEELSEYLEIFNNGIHRDEAYRLIGDLYFERLDYLRAIKNYRALYEEFTGSEAGVEAYFKIGICYKKMGYDGKAVEIFQEIMQYHPDSSYAHHAEVQLDTLGILNEDEKK